MFAVWKVTAHFDKSVSYCVWPQQYQDQPDIEKEVKRLFRMDNEAIDVKWDVVVEDDADQPGTGDSAAHPQQILAHGDVFNPLNSSANVGVVKPVNVEAGDLGRFLGEMSPSYATWWQTWSLIAQ